MAGPHGEECKCPENLDEEGVFHVLSILADKISSKHLDDVPAIGIAVTIIFQDGSGWSAGWASLARTPVLRDAMAHHLNKIQTSEVEIRDILKPEPGEVGN